MGFHVWVLVSRFWFGHVRCPCTALPGTALRRTALPQDRPPQDRHKFRWGLGWVMALNRGHNSTRRPPRERKKNEFCGGRGKKARNFGPPILRAPTFRASTLRESLAKPHLAKTAFGQTNPNLAMSFFFLRHETENNCDTVKTPCNLCKTTKSAWHLPTPLGQTAHGHQLLVTLSLQPASSRMLWLQNKRACKSIVCTTQPEHCQKASPSQQPPSWKPDTTRNSWSHPTTVRRPHQR